MTIGNPNLAADGQHNQFGAPGGNDPNAGKTTTVFIRENGELSQKLRNWSLRAAMRVAEATE